jgi:hypothetical protein
MAKRSRSERARLSALTVQALLHVHEDKSECGLAIIEGLSAKSKTFSASTHTVFLKSSVEVYEQSGEVDAALGCIYELMRLNHTTISDVVGSPSGRLLELDARPSFGRERDVATAKAAELAAMIDERLRSIVNIAVSAGLQGGHDQFRLSRLRKLVRLFAMQVGLTPQVAEEMSFAASICDVGMVAVPADLLQKRRKLHPREIAVVEDHTRIGAELLAQAKLRVLQPAIQVARFHHEEWSGAGPYRLRGEEIPMGARVAAIADCFEALTHMRPWRAELTVEEALAEIHSRSGTKFDPHLTASFCPFVDSLASKHRNLERFLSEDFLDDPYPLGTCSWPLASSYGQRQH